LALIFSTVVASMANSTECAESLTVGVAINAGFTAVIGTAGLN